MEWGGGVGAEGRKGERRGVKPRGAGFTPVEGSEARGGSAARARLGGEERREGRGGVKKRVGRW